MHLHRYDLFPRPRSLVINADRTYFYVEAFHRNSQNIEQFVDFICDTDLPQQGFVVEVEHRGIVVKYADALAKRYAISVIEQLIEQTGDHLPAMTIEDHPDYLQRGVILDVSRDKIPTMETLFSLIDFWSELRYNQLQLYTEHTFAYQQHSKVWQGYSPLTAQQIQTIDQYCQDKGIELVPNQATFGHMEKWLCHQDYKHLAEQTTGFYDQRNDFRPESFGLNPLSEEVAEFVEKLLDELLPNFSSNTVNVNFDETMDLGYGASRELCKEKGKGQVYLSYLHKVLSMVKKHGLRCQIFSDMLFRYPEIISELPSDIELLNWGYEEDHPFDEEHQQLQQFGYKYQVVVSTNTFASIAGRAKAMAVHMRRGAESGIKYGAEGYQVSQWGDMGHAQQFFTDLPGYQFGAYMAWNNQAHDDEDMYQPWLIERHFGREYAQCLPAVRQLQMAYLSSGVTTPNCAFYGPFTFDHRSKRHIKRAVISSQAELEKSLFHLADIERDIIQLDDSQLKSQLLWTVKCMRLATVTASEMAKFSIRDTEKLPLGSKQKISDHIDVVLQHYRELWLYHYREGGLNQSLSRLTDFKALCEAELEMTK